jgi:hypothetical protein
MESSSGTAFMCGILLVTSGYKCRVCIDYYVFDLCDLYRLFVIYLRVDLLVGM